MSSGNNIRKIALLFPGQGSQYSGMVRDLFEQYSCIKDLFQQAQDITGVNCKTLLFDENAEELKKIDNAQIATTLADLCAFFALKEEGLCSSHITGIAGFSLGEYPALVAAKVIDTELCFRLVYHRSSIIQKQSEILVQKYGESGMAAVIGLSSKSVEKVLELSGLEHVFCANYNSPKQVVISGVLKEIDILEPQLKEAGASRVLRLAVSGPFHTPLLKEAADMFAEVLSRLQFRNPVCSIFSNVTGKCISSGEEVKKLLVDHIVSPVQWINVEYSLKSILGESYLIIESGPGRVLANLWKELGFNQVYAAGKYEEIIQACSLL